MATVILKKPLSWWLAAAVTRLLLDDDLFFLLPLGALPPLGAPSPPPPPVLAAAAAAAAAALTAPNTGVSNARLRLGCKGHCVVPAKAMPKIEWLREGRNDVKRCRTDTE